MNRQADMVSMFDASNEQTSRHGKHVEAYQMISMLEASNEQTSRHGKHGKAY
jgi:hypothetical protein